jgi:hypothetical protein
MNSFFTWHIFLEVGKAQDLLSKIWQTLGCNLFVISHILPITKVLTPKIGTGKRLTCESNLAEEHHSSGGFPQSIR